MFRGWRKIQLILHILLLFCAGIGIATFIYGIILCLGLPYFLSRWYDISDNKLDFENLHFDIAKEGSELTDMDVGPVLAVQAVLFLLGGILLFTYANFGIIAIKKRRTRLLIIVVGLVICSLLMGYIIFAELYDLESKTHTVAKQSLAEQMRKEFKSQSKNQKYWNSIMVMGECCGIFGPGDFMFNIGHDDHANKDDNLIRMWPPACCKKSLLYLADIKMDCYEFTLVEDVFDNVSPKRCYDDVMYNLFGVGQVFASIFIVKSVLEVIVVGMASALLFLMKYTVEQAEQEFDDEEEPSPQYSPQETSITEDMRSYDSNRTSSMSLTEKDNATHSQLLSDEKSQGPSDEQSKAHIDEKSNAHSDKLKATHDDKSRRASGKASNIAEL